MSASAEAVRKLLSALQDDPENEGAWTQLEERAVGGELATLGTEGKKWLEEARRRYLAQGEAEAAARILDIEAMLLDGDPAQRVAVVRERARILEEDLLDDRSAMMALESIKSLDPEAAEAYERLARKKDKWKDLVDAFRKHAAETQEPSQIASYLTSAAAVVLQYKSKNRDKDADTLFQEALSVDPGNLRAIQLYERVLRRRGNDWDKLAAHLERSAEAVVDPGSKIALLLRAARVHAGRRKDFAAAERIYRHILRLDPAHPDANRFLVMLLGELGRVDDLVKLYEDQLRLPGHEQDVGLLIQVAMTHWRMRNDPASAAPYFRRVMELQPDHVLPRNFFAEHPQYAPRGEATARTGSSTPTAETAHASSTSTSVGSVSASSASDGSAALDTPKQAHPRLLQAIEAAEKFEAAGQTDKAIDAWKGVLRLDASNRRARESLAALYARAGRWNNVVELLRQELESLGGTRPGPEGQAHRDRKLEILREMVRIYRDKMGLEPMVVQTYNAILTIAPDDLDALTALAQSYEKLGRFTDLIKVLEQQAEHTADPAEKINILQRVARIWVEKFNNVNNAAKPLEQILTIDPTNAEAIRELKDLYTKRRAWRPLFEVLRKEAATLSGVARRDALIELAKLAAEKLNAPGEAIAVWREVLTVDPHAPGALDALEKLTERERDYSGLAEVLEQRAQETTDPEARVNVLMKLGAVYSERLNDTARSIHAWRRVLEVKPGHPKALRVLREAYIAAGDWDALEALYAEVNDYEGLVEVLGTAADRADDPAVKVALSFRAAAIYEQKLGQPMRAFRSYERVLSVEPKNLRAASALVPIYLSEEKWARLAQLYEILLEAVPAQDVEQALDYLERLRELAAHRLGDRQAAFRWALRAYQLRPTDPRLEATLEKTASEASAWRELVEAFDARAAATEDESERSRLRDKCAAIEADRLGAIDAAIARYQAALQRNPTDAQVTEALERLLRRAERWHALRELFELRLQNAQSPAERRELLFELARIEEERLGNADAASARYREVLRSDPHDAEALSALSRLAESAGRWEELAALIAQRRDEASGALRAELALKLGQLRSDRLQDKEGAIASFREVLSLVPHHPAALAALEELMRDERYRLAVATILEPEFQAIGAYPKLAWVLQILLDASRDPDERKTLALRLARVYSDQLNDPRSGFELLRSVLTEQPTQRELVDELEALATRGNWNEELADTLSRIVARTDLPREVKVDLARRAAAVYDDRLQRHDAAEPFHRIVIDQGELDQHAFVRLKTLYQERERWDDLRALYALWVERSPDVATKIELLGEEALVVEEILDRPDDAIEVYRKIQSLDPGHRAALRALDRLYVRQQRWSDLATLLTQWIEYAPEEAHELRFRRGEVYERQLGEFERALEDYQAVVAANPSHPGARAGLERLVASRPELRRRAAAVLESLYESDGPAGAANLVRMILVRLEGTSAPDEQAALHRRIAELRETILGDTRGAFDAMVQAMLADPNNDDYRKEVLRLAEIAGTNSIAAEAFEQAARDERSRPSLVAILRETALIYDERLGDLTNAERTYRRLLDVAPDDTEVSLACAVALERIYQALGNITGLVEALQLRAKLEIDPDVRRELYARAGELQETELRDLPAAIASHRARLDIEPTDRSALKALERLYEATGQWRELVATLQADAALSTNAEDQKDLQLRAARTLEEKLADIDAAIELYRDVLASFGPDREVHRSLARLYELSDRWNDLLDILERDLEVAESPPDRLELIVRIAELRRLRTNDRTRAVEGYQEALSIDPQQPQARAALDTLLTDTEPSVALAAARALAPVLEAEGAWERLVAVLDRIASQTDDPDERRRTLARAAEVCEIGLTDPGRAFRYAAREFKLALSEDDLRPRLEHMERLATEAGLHADLARTLEDVAPDLVDPDLQLDVLMKIATLASGPLADRAKARTYYEKAIEQRPDYTPALDALEALHEATGAYTELIDVLRRKIDLAVTDSERRELLRKLARVSEERLGDRQAAARAYESILELGEDREAIQALERIYAAESRWEDLTRLLESQLTSPNADVVDLHHRLGVVAATHLDDPDRAIDHFREVLERHSDHAPTVAALEQLGQREGYAARVAEMLEPIYLARMDWPKVIAALEARIAAETDLTARKELLARLGSLYEESLEDLDRALDTYARLFREDIADRSTWEVIARLARLLGRFDKQAEIYAGALADVTVDDEATAEIAFQAAQLYDRHVGDSRRARELYRRALAFDPTRREVFEALESLLVRERSHQELLALYREAARDAADPEEQKGYYFKIAEIQENALGDLTAAIETYQQVLDIDPTDARATGKLDELFSRTERWNDLADLLDRRVNDAIDSEERATLRYRLGKLRAERLNDPAGAVDAFEAILQERRDHREAIAALEQLSDANPDLRTRIVEILEPLYRELDDWPKLIVVLNVRLEAARDPVERSALLREIGHIKERRAQDIHGAFAAYGSAFAADPGDGEARAEVERLAAQHGLWDDLVRTYEAALEATTDPIIKADLLKAIAETHDTRRDDPRAAIEAYERLYALDESQIEALDLLQGLHVLLSDWEGLVRVLERKVERSLDDEQRKSLLHEIGEYQRDMLGNNEAAIHAFRRALELDPSDGVALEALDDLYSASGDARALADVLRQRLEIETDPESRKTLALRLGRLWEKDLDDANQAIEAYRRVLDDAPTEMEALLALDRLYQRTAAHADLLENLRTQAGLATDETTRNALRLRIGRLLAGELADPAGALEVYREVLASDSSNAEAIAMVRRLAQLEDQRPEAVAILEPIFRQAGRWDELAETLEIKIGTLDDPFARRDELRALAEVHETGRRDGGQAFDTYRRALHEDPSHGPTLADLERLAATLNRWNDLTTILEEEAAVTADETVARDLAVKAAQIAEDRLHDDARATAAYRRALSYGDDDAILAALDRIYLRSEKWHELLEVLERRVAVAAEPALLDQLDTRIAELKERQFGDPAGALSAYRNVLERTPSHAEALAGVERLLEVPAVRAEAMDLLEQTYTTLDNPHKLAWLLSLRVQDTELASDKVRLLQDLARLREERLQDVSGAFAAMVEAFKLDPRDEQIVAEIERLAAIASAWSQLRGVVEAAIDAHRDKLDGSVIAQLNLRAARWYREQLGDNVAAESRLRAALEYDPESTEALEMLEAIHREPGRERDLVSTLRRRAEIELDISARKQMLREAAALAEHQLGNVDLAAEITTSLLDTDDSDIEALETLARLRTLQGRHADVAELLSRRARLTDDPDVAMQLRRRVAELYAGPINDLDKAVQAYRELLDFNPNDQQARDAIEDIFERTGRYKDLEEALRSRIEAAVSSEERNATRLRLAKLAETRFSNPNDAIEYLREILEETPSHVEAGRELERLYTQERRWSELSDLLERRAQDYADAGDLAGELATLVRIGELNERELANRSRAVELYERVLERDPNHVGALEALARLHEADGQWERAADMLARATSLAVPGRQGAEVALRLATVRAERLGDEPGTEQALRRALELDPSCQQAIDQLKALAQKRNDPRMLAEVLEREAEIATEPSRRVAIYKSLADIARDKLGDPDRSARYLERARELAPEDRDLLLPLVDMYIAAGRQRDAVPVIEKIIASYGNKRSKELATWHHRLGQALEALGDTAGALTQYDAAFKIDLTSVPILRDLGLLCYRTGDLDRAQKTFRALLLQRLDASSGISKADVYYYLADTLRQQNDIPKAINMAERALEADKSHARAAALLAQLKGG